MKRPLKKTRTVAIVSAELKYWQKQREDFGKRVLGPTKGTINEMVDRLTMELNYLQQQEQTHG